MPNAPSTTANFVMPADVHNRVVGAAYRRRGYTAEEADAAARFSELTARHGIKTHNAFKALHLDDHFGCRAGGCRPGATIDKLPPRYKAVARWNANPFSRMALNESSSPAKLSLVFSASSSASLRLCGCI